MDDAQSYEAIRNTIAVYTRGKRFFELTGLQRTELLNWILAKNTEYVMPGTCVESLALDEDGKPIDLVLAMFEEDRTVLVSDVENGVLDNLAPIIEELDLDDVQVNELEGWCAVGVEGPNCYEILNDLLEDDIAGMSINERRDAESPLGAPGTLARIGKTAEYGWTWLGQADEQETYQAFLERAEENDGGPATEQALYRAQLEVNNAIFPDMFEGVTLREAGMEWFAGSGREDDYRGKPEEDPGFRERGFIAVECPGSDLPEKGTAVMAGDTKVGEIFLKAPLVGTDRGYGLALLDAPFEVPGLDLVCGDVEIKTIPRPAVEPISWVQPIGEQEGPTALQEAMAELTAQRTAAAEAAARAQAEAEAAASMDPEVLAALEAMDKEDEQAVSEHAYQVRAEMEAKARAAAVLDSIEAKSDAAAQAAKKSPAGKLSEQEIAAKGKAQAFDMAKAKIKAAEATDISSEAEAKASEAEAKARQAQEAAEEAKIKAAEAEAKAREAAEAKASAKAKLSKTAPKDGANA